MATYSPGMGIRGPFLLASGISCTGSGLSISIPGMECLGAKAVVFYVRSVADTGVWAASNALIPETTGFLGESPSGNATPARLGYVQSTALNGTPANVGSATYVVPRLSDGANEPAHDSRIVSPRMGCKLTAGAATITGVNVWGLTIWE